MTKLRNRNKTKRRHHVTKRRSHRTRSQRGGGDWANTLSFGLLGNSDEPIGTGRTSWYDWFTGPTEEKNTQITESIKSTVNDLDAKVGEAATTAKNVIIDEASALTENAKNLISGEEKETYNTGISSPVIGGKSRKYNKKGGANLGLLYYATPIKGGKKHKYSCCKGKGKRHKHNASCSRK